MARKSKQPVVGDVVQIALGDGRFCFGVVLPFPRVAFFDLCVSSIEGLDVQELGRRPVLFHLWVMKYALTKEWPVVGHIEVSPELLGYPDYFIEDPLSGELVITQTGFERVPATIEEVSRLERATAWDPPQVAERLRDHYAGRPCKRVLPIGWFSRRRLEKARID